MARWAWIAVPVALVAAGGGWLAFDLARSAAEPDLGPAIVVTVEPTAASTTEPTPGPTASGTPAPTTQPSDGAATVAPGTPPPAGDDDDDDDDDDDFDD